MTIEILNLVFRQILYLNIHMYMYELVSQVVFEMSDDYIEKVKNGYEGWCLCLTPTKRPKYFAKTASSRVRK